MDCKGLTNDRLVDYSERLVEGEERAAIDKHLNGCRPCRIRYEEVKRLAGAVRSTLRTPVHKALTDQLDAAVLGNLDALMAQARPNPFRRRTLWAGSIAAAACIAIVAIIWVSRGGRGDSRTDEPIVKTTPPPRTEQIPIPPPPRTEEPVAPATETVPPPATTETAPPPPPTTQAPPPPPVTKTETAPPPPPPKTETPVIPESPRTKTTTPEKSDPPRVEPPKQEPVRVVVKGDFNRNGKVDGEDVAFLDAQIIAGRTQDPALADVTGDGRVDCGDVLAMLQSMERRP